MEALAVVGLASAVVQFVDFSTKICSLFKELSGVKGAPKKLLELSFEVEQKIVVLKSSNQRKLTPEEVAVILACTEKAKILLNYLANCKVDESKKSGRIAKGVFTFKMAHMAVAITFDEGKLRDFRDALDRLVGLAMLQILTRTENSVDRVEDNTLTLIDAVKTMQISVAAPSINPYNGQEKKSVFMVSYPRNPAFVGRKDIFQKLDAQLSATQATTHVQKAALYGLGGTGKTQIALEYAYKLRDTTSVIWVYAANTARFEQDFKSIAEEFQLPGRNDPQADVMELVKRFLNTEYKKQWLLIIDNVDNNHIFSPTSTQKNCHEYIPENNPNGRVLFTSRNREVCLNLVDDPVDLPVMSKSEAKNLLGARLTSTSSESDQLMLLEELDYLPLAITQATKYMTMLRKTIPQYLAQFQDGKVSKIGLLSQQFADTGRRERSMESMITTWAISFDYIRKVNKRAAELLSLMSFLDRQSIPMALVIGDDENVTIFEIAIGFLENFSLIIMTEDRDSCSMHRLVQIVTQEWSTSQLYNDDHDFAALAVERILTRFPYGESYNWQTCSLYMPHAEAVLNLELEDCPTNISARAWLFHTTGSCLRMQGKFDSAMDHTQNSYRLFRGMSEEESENSLAIKVEMGRILRQEENVAKAEAIFRQVLEEIRRLLGPDNYLYSMVLENLAYTIRDSNNAEAETLLRQALSLRENRVNGDIHDSGIVICKQHLGIVLMRSGQFAKAEQLIRNAKTYFELRYGEFHEHTFAAILNLSALFIRSGDYEKAEELLNQARSISEKIHGKTHLLYINVLSHLGACFQLSGRLHESEEMFRERFRLAEEHFGESHALTHIALLELVAVMKCQDRSEAAEELILKAIAGAEISADPDSATALKLREALANLHLLPEEHRQNEQERQPSSIPAPVIDGGSSTSMKNSILKAHTI